MRYLRSDAGRQGLAEVDRLRLTDTSLVSDIASARGRFGDRTAVLVETVKLRRKAAVKFPDAADWLFTDEALQQATAAPVAEHRARRLAGATVHDATCSIGTELAALRNWAVLTLGSDIDAVRLAMARNNLGPDVALCRADALRPDHRRRGRARRPGSPERIEASLRSAGLCAAA